MILKIALNEGWRYVSGVKELQSARYSAEAFNKAVGHLSGPNCDVLLYYHDIKDGTIRRTDKTPKDAVIVELLPTLESGELKMFLADSSIYLMSDEGKTIERIN